MDERWICVRLDARGLWTADLYDGETLVGNLGGSYPKSNSTVLDSKKTWGLNLEVRILPNGYIATTEDSTSETTEYMGYLEE